MLLPLAYLTAANAFAVLRLLPMTDRDKDAELRMYVLAVIEHHTRRIRVLGATRSPDRSVGDPSGAEPGHGSGGCRLLGTVLDP